MMEVGSIPSLFKRSWRLISEITCMFMCQGLSQGYIFDEGITFFCDRHWYIKKKQGYT